MTFVIYCFVLFPGTHFSYEVIFVYTYYENNPFPWMFKSVFILYNNFNVMSSTKLTMLCSAVESVLHVVLFLFLF